MYVYTVNCVWVLSLCIAGLSNSPYPHQYIYRELWYPNNIYTVNSDRCWNRFSPRQTLELAAMAAARRTATSLDSASAAGILLGI